MQTEMRTFQQIKNPGFLSLELIATCKDGTDALRLCIQASRVKYTQGQLADLLEIDRGHFSRILNGNAHFPDGKRTELMRLCGNLAPLQFEVIAMGYDLVEKQETLEEKLARLEAENAALRSAV